MVTLSDAQALSQSKLTNYVIDEFKKSALLDLLPFDNTVKPTGAGQSMSYTYNRVTTLPTAASRAFGSEYTPQEAKTTQYTVNLKALGGSFQVDRVVANYERQVANTIKFQLAQKAQATRALFADLFINGDSGVTASDFDGLDKALTGSSTELTPSAAIDLSSSSNIDTNWKVFLDALRSVRATLDGAASIMLMNSDLFGIFQSVMDRAGINLASKSNYGDEVVQWGPTLVQSLGDKPGTSNPVVETSAGITSLYMARFGEDGVHGVSPEGDTIVKEYLPNMTLPGAVKTGEVEMVAAVAVKATKAAGVLRNIKIA